MLDELLEKQNDFIFAELKKSPEIDFSNLSVIEQINQLIFQWKIMVKQSIDSSQILIKPQKKLRKWKKQNKKRKFFILNCAAIGDYHSLCLELKCSFNLSFWQDAEKKINKLNQKSQIEPLNEEEQKYIKETSELFLDSWQRTLDKALTSRYLRKINQERKKSLEGMKKMFLLKKRLKKLGLEDNIGWGLGLGNWNEQEFGRVLHWAEHFTTDAQAKRIMELLGRCNEITEKNSELSFIQVKTSDKMLKEEVIALKLEKQIESVLPSELALMADPETAILFDLKYLENKLLCFEYKGQSSQRKESKSPNGKGPMILCVDTSGSMYGEPEYIAKAVALYLSQQSKKQNRKCFLISFSTEIETFELTGKTHFNHLIDFLKMSFHGGTDATPALKYAVKLLKQDYQEADVLMISDFQMGALSNELLTDIQQLRKKSNRFNSLVIGSRHFYQKKWHTEFDREWIFNSDNKKIEEFVLLPIQDARLLNE